MRWGFSRGKEKGVMRVAKDRVDPEMFVRLASLKSLFQRNISGNLDQGSAF